MCARKEARGKTNPQLGMLFGYVNTTPCFFFLSRMVSKCGRADSTRSSQIMGTTRRSVEVPTTNDEFIADSVFTVFTVFWKQCMCNDR